MCLTSSPYRQWLFSRFARIFFAWFKKYLLFIGITSSPYRQWFFYAFVRNFFVINKIPSISLFHTFFRFGNRISVGFTVYLLLGRDFSPHPIGRDFFFNLYESFFEFIKPFWNRNFSQLSSSDFFVDFTKVFYEFYKTPAIFAPTYLVVTFFDLHGTIFAFIYLVRTF